MERTTISLPAEQVEAVEQIVFHAGSTRELPTLKKSEVYRMVFTAGMESLLEGDLEVDGMKLNEYVSGDATEEARGAGDVRPSSQEGESVTCGKCGYEWRYSGSLPTATCPSCSRKVDVHGDEKEETEKTPLECGKCGYSWFYKGERMTATCPSCKSTVTVETDA